LAHRLIEVGVRIQAAAIIIAERVGTPTLEELVETDEISEAGLSAQSKVKAEAPTSNQP
jgi:hypothetical protein